MVVVDSSIYHLSFIEYLLYISEMYFTLLIFQTTG